MSTGAQTQFYVENDRAGSFTRLFGTCATGLEIIRPEARVLRDPRQHLGADFLVIVKREHEVRPCGTG
jgi:hypothetical protein